MDRHLRAFCSRTSIEPICVSENSLSQLASISTSDKQGAANAKPHLYKHKVKPSYINHKLEGCNWQIPRTRTINVVNSFHSLSVPPRMFPANVLLPSKWQTELIGDIWEKWNVQSTTSAHHWAEVNKKGFLNITKQQIIVEGSLFFPELINICFVCIVPLCRLMMAIFHSVHRQKQRNVLVLIKYPIC